MLDQAFGYARLGLVLPLMQHACQDMLAGLAAVGNAAGQTRQINASQVMTHVTADIIFRTIFSAKLELEDSNQLVGAFSNYQRYSQLMLVCKLLRLPSLWFGHKRLAYAATIREFLERKVQTRLEFLSTADEQSGRDILSGLRCATQADTGLALSKAQLVDQVCMLFLAGHETSSTALSWCVFIMAQMPELQQQLREEVASVPLADVGRLRLMQAVIKEVLRLYPPVGYFPREATHEHTIRGSKVRVGDALLVFPWLLHRHRKWWLESEAFDPQRFLAPRTGPAASAYMPFGAGPRACMGAGFAMQEIALVLAELLKHYQVLPVPGFEPEVVGRLTVKPSPDIQVLLQPIQAGSANCDARVTPQ
jgi:cytochrome P450